MTDRLLQRFCSERGAAVVEFALVLPLLLLLMFGLIDFTMAYQRNVTLTHAAREGVRAWALAPPTSPTNPTPATRDAATGIDPATIEVVCATATATGTWTPSPATTAACSTPCTAGEPAQVTARHNYAYITPVASVFGMFGGNTLAAPTLRGEGVMRCGG